MKGDERVRVKGMLGNGIGNVLAKAKNILCDKTELHAKVMVKVGWNNTLASQGWNVENS